MVNLRSQKKERKRKRNKENEIMIYSLIFCAI